MNGQVSSTRYKQVFPENGRGKPGLRVVGDVDKKTTAKLTPPEAVALLNEVVERVETLCITTGKFIEIQLEVQKEVERLFQVRGPLMIAISEDYKPKEKTDANNEEGEDFSWLTDQSSYVFTHGLMSNKLWERNPESDILQRLNVLLGVKRSSPEYRKILGYTE